MTCASCKQKSKKAKEVKAKEAAVATAAMNAERAKKIPTDMKESDMLYAPRSADQSKKVRLIYNGGGTKKKTGGCSTCHGGRPTYAVTTTETIMFVSEDVPTMVYKETVSVGHSYYVTEEQAKVMLGMTFTNQSGQKVHKFTKGD